MHRSVHWTVLLQEINPEKNVNWAEDAHTGNINEEVRETLLAKVRYSRRDAERQLRRVRVVNVDTCLVDMPLGGVVLASASRRTSSTPRRSGRRASAPSRRPSLPRRSNNHRRTTSTSEEANTATDASPSDCTRTPPTTQPSSTAVHQNTTHNNESRSSNIQYASAFF